MSDSSCVHCVKRTAGFCSGDTTRQVWQAKRLQGWEAPQSVSFGGGDVSEREWGSSRLQSQIPGRMRHDESDSQVLTIDKHTGALQPA